MQQDYAYYRQIFADRAKPFAYVDLDLLDQNVQAILKRSGDKRIRLASKSIRSVAILRRLLDADPRFQGIMCFTAREAVWLASQGFDDLLIGYPTWQLDDIAAVAHAVAAGKQITLMVDSVEHVEHIAEIARQHDARLSVCIEVDLSIDVPGLHFGVWRSTIRTPAQARPVVESILAAPQLTLDGIMGYEAQVAGLGDTFPGKAVQNRIVRALKRRSVSEAAARRAALLDLIASYDHSLRFVNGGGTGSVATTREEAGVTEITVGSGFYSPALFDYYRDFHYLPAAGFAVEIVRRPRPDLYTCLGGGYIASGATGAEKQPRPYLPDGAQLLPTEGAGEVQTPVRYAGSERLALGDPIFLRHSKAGELCEHFSHLALVSGGQIAGEAETYRGA
ncbi:MAG TPA: amino acid deaminase/aldolase, partial [Ktedonobacterales bacterium]|nr:amino acid deaminase/aldolase [Ktedonobacterales bacterium]